MSFTSRRTTFSCFSVLIILTATSCVAVASNAGETTPHFAAESASASVPKNLFKEYMTKGLYQCTSKYVHTLSKLHALIKEAFEEYTECERLLSEAPGKKSTENELLDRLLDELDAEEEDGTDGASSGDSLRVDASAGLSRSVRARRAPSSVVANSA